MKNVKIDAQTPWGRDATVAVLRVAVLICAYFRHDARARVVDVAQPSMFSALSLLANRALNFLGQWRLLLVQSS